MIAKATDNALLISCAVRSTPCKRRLDRSACFNCPNGGWAPCDIPQLQVEHATRLRGWGGGRGELGNGVDPHHALACAYQARVTAPAHKVTLFLAFVWAGNAACIPLTKGGVMTVDISQQVFRLNFLDKTPLELHTRLLVTFYYCISDLKPQP